MSSGKKRNIQNFSPKSTEKAHTRTYKYQLSGKGEENTYPFQNMYTPHTLIPGNESANENIPTKRYSCANQSRCKPKCTSICI